MKAYVNSAWRDVTTAKVFFSGAWRTIASSKAYVGAAWRSVATLVSPPTLSIAPQGFVGFGAGYAQKTLTATPSGGLAPYSYAWTVTSNSSPVDLTNGTTATATVGGNATAADITVSLSCVVTDSLSATASATTSGTLVNRDTSRSIL